MIEDTKSTSERNRFDLLRLVAALLVFFSHLFSIFGRGEPALSHQAVVFSHVGGRTIAFSAFSLGTLGVTIFFSISGYLIARSASLRPLKTFAASRALRIMPAYAAHYCLVVLVLGALVTRLTAADYYAALGGELLRYFPGMLFPSHIPDLPGVYTGNPIAFMVNASLWTLPYECWMYAFVYAVIRMQKKLGLPVLPLAVCVYIAVMLVDRRFLPQNDEGNAPLYCLSFLIGSVLYVYGERLKLRAGTVILLLLALAAGADKSWFVYLYPFALPCLVIYAAMSPGLKALPMGRLKWDLSYAIYLYGWPIGQAFAYWFPHSWPLYAAGTTLSVLAMAALSWNVIEQPALRRRKLLKSETSAGG